MRVSVNTNSHTVYLAVADSDYGIAEERTVVDREGWQVEFCYERSGDLIGIRISESA